MLHNSPRSYIRSKALQYCLWVLVFHQILFVVVEPIRIMNEGVNREKIIKNLANLFLLLLLIFIQSTTILNHMVFNIFLLFLFPSNEEYITYKGRTSALVLFPPFLYQRLNRIIKMLFCFEFPMYNNVAGEEYDQMSA